jgi:hypothetical protein
MKWVVAGQDVKTQEHRTATVEGESVIDALNAAEQIGLWQISARPVPESLDTLASMARSQRQ